MCKICEAKTTKIDTLAAYFRVKARGTSLIRYKTMMSNAALSLDELSIEIERRCRCIRPVRNEPYTSAGPHQASNFNW
jgi:hypothetical protein